LAEGPILNGPASPSYRDEDGELLEGTIDLPFTLDHRRAQRLQRAFMESARLGKTITCRVDLRILARSKEELIGQVVRFDSDLFPQANGDYLVISMGFADNFSSIELSLTEYDSTIETSWNPHTDEQEFELTDLDVS
jgi:hypothetical protein